MNLDDFKSFPNIDTQNFLSYVDALPDQLQKAWELGQALPLPDWQGIQQVVIAGMGGSAIGGDLLEAYSRLTCRVPIVVHRDYDLPAWARGPQTLCIASSHSGNTEEVLSSFKVALASGCRCLSISTGGKLAQASKEAGTPLWTFVHAGQPRTAVGFSFGLLLALLRRLELIPDPSSELTNAIHAMQEQQPHLQAHVPVVKNPAKRMAGQLIGRWVTVLGSGILAPVARRWKCQISEVGKAWAQFEYLPEADHNTLAGTQQPAELLPRMMVLFLRAPSDHSRNRLRAEITRQVFMLDGFNTDFIDAQGETPLAHLWTCLHFGDYATYYLAMAYDVDPTPITVMESLKEQLKSLH